MVQIKYIPHCIFQYTLYKLHIIHDMKLYIIYHITILYTILPYHIPLVIPFLYHFHHFSRCFPRHPRAAAGFRRQRGRGGRAVLASLTPGTTGPGADHRLGAFVMDLVPTNPQKP